MTKAYDLDDYSFPGATLHLATGNVLCIISDDGPTGICCQDMRTTCAHMVIHHFDNEEAYRAWRETANTHRRGRNVKETIVVIGDWSSPGLVGLQLHGKSALRRRCEGGQK